MPLLIDPPPLRPGEDPREFLRAAAHVNGMTLKRVKADDLDCIQPSTFTQTQYAGADHSHQVNPSWSDVLSSMRTRNGRGRAICTQCLAESRPVLRCWQSASMSYCTRHQCALINRCPGCSKKLQWSDPFEEHCRKCFLNWKGVPAPKLSHFAHNLHRAVALNVSPTGVGAVGETDSFFTDQDDRKLDDALRRLNRVRSVVVGERRLPKLPPSSTALPALWELVAGDSFERVLDRATETGRRFLQISKSMRPKRYFPTGWSHLDKLVEERLGASLRD
jgi:hypothetical protein